MGYGGKGKGGNDWGNRPQGGGGYRGGGGGNAIDDMIRAQENMTKFGKLCKSFVTPSKKSKRHDSDEDESDDDTTDTKRILKLLEKREKKESKGSDEKKLEQLLNKFTSGNNGGGASTDNSPGMSPGMSPSVGMFGGSSSPSSPQTMVATDGTKFVLIGGQWQALAGSNTPRAVAPPGYTYDMAGNLTPCGGGGVGGGVPPGGGGIGGGGGHGGGHAPPGGGGGIGGGLGGGGAPPGVPPPAPNAAFITPLEMSAVIGWLGGGIAYMPPAVNETRDKFKLDLTRSMTVNQWRPRMVRCLGMTAAAAAAIGNRAECVERLLQGCPFC